jgi:hypothetical protein
MRGLGQRPMEKDLEAISKLIVKFKKEKDHDRGLHS